MNEETEKQILNELRRLNTFNRRSLVFIPVFIVAIVGLLIFMDYLTGRLRWQKPHSASWTEVQLAMDREDNDEALRLATILMTKSHTNYYGESWLGSIYHAKGELQQAEQHYARAYDLFPTEDGEKKLTAIRKVLKQETD
ncbi:MAG: hypothetical protein AAB393_15685 [Bacteroidota bacterium]